MQLSWWNQLKCFTWHRHYFAIKIEQFGNFWWFLILMLYPLNLTILLIYLWKVISPDQLFSYSCLSSNTVNNLSSKRLFYHKVKCTVFLLQWDLFFHSQLFHWSWRSEMLLPLKVDSKTLEISEIYWKLSKTATTLQTELIWQKKYTEKHWKFQDFSGETHARKPEKYQA